MSKDSSRYKHTTQKQMVYELWDTLVGKTDKEGFIHEMRSFKENTEKTLDKLDKKIHETRKDVAPIVSMFSNWRVVTGFIIGFIGLISMIVYIIVHLGG